MRLGLYVPVFDELADPALVARLCAEAEEAGWDGVFVWDQVRWREPVVAVADPQITLPAIARATERLRLGPMVTLGEMLARAASKELETLKADAERLPFEDESFDGALMVSMLHHVDDRGAAWAEARRILKVGGQPMLTGFTGKGRRVALAPGPIPEQPTLDGATHPPPGGVHRRAPPARAHRDRIRAHAGRALRLASGRHGVRATLNARRPRIGTPLRWTIDLKVPR